MARNPEQRSDGDLLSGTVAGESTAFAVFYQRYLPRVAGLLMRMTRDPEVAADLTTEVFAAVLLSASRYEGAEGDSAWPWVCGIAQNKLRESRRRGQVEDRARRRLSFEPEVLDDADLQRVEELGADAEVLVLLDGLPERQRLAVRARIVDEREYSEIAAELRCSEMVAWVRAVIATGRSRWWANRPLVDEDLLGRGRR